MLQINLPAFRTLIYLNVWIYENGIKVLAPYWAVLGGFFFLAKVDDLKIKVPLTPKFFFAKIIIFGVIWRKNFWIW